tara:strand:+ start:12396 stop:13070 length:675 start_codon:yes stop_codon:yes gene_type:complete
MSYVKISNFGKGAAYAPMNNPLTYGMTGGMDNSFMHGSDRIDSNSREFQVYAAEYCSKKFDQFCEVMANNGTTQYYPNLVHTGSTQSTSPGQNWCEKPVTAGDVLVLNTARTKYLKQMRNGVANRTPFDPTVAASPMITTWTGEYLIPEYHIPQGHDLANDQVMHRLLNKPLMSLPLLANIHKNMHRSGRLAELNNTKLGMFYDNLKKNASQFPMVQNLTTMMY